MRAEIRVWEDGEDLEGGTYVNNSWGTLEDKCTSWQFPNSPSRALFRTLCALCPETKIYPNTHAPPPLTLVDDISRSLYRAAGTGEGRPAQRDKKTRGRLSKVIAS